MKHNMLLALLCLLLSQLCLGQLPPVTFPANTHMCDETPWKLVFFDDFNGDKLDLSKWHTHIVWDGNESDDWGGARADKGFLSILRDENVLVSKGSVKLFTKHQQGSWKCNSCPDSLLRNRNYTSGELQTWYTNRFNSGKFEARIKMPTFKWAHSTFWTWFGTEVNEIDIAEAYGDPYWPYYPLGIGNNRYCNYSLHAWAPNFNPYNLSDNVEIRNHYPGHTWYDRLMGRYFDQSIYHTYTCEWDTARVSFYLDQERVNTIYKYYRSLNFIKWVQNDGNMGHHYITYKIITPADCATLASGTYNILPGFVHNNDSHCNLRLSTGIDKDDSPPTDHSITTLGQMEIDYVKAWQRHPEADGHTDLCNTPLPVISGPNIICNKASYSVSNIDGPNLWTTSSDLSITGLSNSTTGISGMSLQGKPGAKDWGFIRFKYSAVTGCPEQEVIKKVDIGAPIIPHTNCVRANNNGNISYVLFATRVVDLSQPNAPSGYNAPTTFEWNVEYGPGYASTYHAFGQFIATPSLPYSFNTGVRWTLKTTNACGSVRSTGGKFYLFKGTGTNSTADSTVHFFTADITDSAGYEQAVYDRVAATFMEDVLDTAAIYTMIDRIRTEELAPYIALDQDQETGNKNVPIGLGATDTKIYPNPATHLLNILPGTSFTDAVPIEVTVYDISGKLVLSKIRHKEDVSGFSIDLSYLKNAVYTIELAQGACKEHHKIVKE